MFDEFSQDLFITDASEEAQCQQVREFLGFEPNYVDDYEICREFYDIKCDYENGNTDAILFDKPRGGKIPDFQGFEFKPASFDGFVFSASEFVGFEFEGFEPSADLTFQEVEKVEMAEAASRKYHFIWFLCCWPFRHEYYVNMQNSHKTPYLVILS